MGCGSSADAVRIGIITDCAADPTFAQDRPPEIAGAELPLILKGGSVGGRPVKLEIVCAESLNPRAALLQLEFLVQSRHVAAVVGPVHEIDPIEARYARKQPGVVFMLAGYGESTTLRSPAPNMFRFELDGSQESAGLASYAYHQLGWRRVTTIGEGDPAGWSSASGFNAEFCSLGGHVQRLWVPGAENHLASQVRRVHSRSDGVFLAPMFAKTSGFVRRWAARGHDLPHRLVVGWSAADPSNPRLRGVVAVSSVPWAQTPALRGYEKRFANAFPKIQDPGLNGLTYYDEVEPLLQALQKVHGDTSNRERSLQHALANLHYDSPEGPVHLDGHNQAIGPTYLGRIAGGGVIRQFAVIQNVDETFGRYFLRHPTPPGPHSPGCFKGKPPPWAVRPTR
jgi:branched-chain amino acid transport system substrate-binding protein